MEDQTELNEPQAQVIEKRLSKGVIRRRVKADAPAPAAAEPKAVAAPVVPTAAPEVVAEPKLTVEPVVQEVVKVAPAEPVKAPVVTPAPAAPVQKGLRVMGQIELPNKKKPVVAKEPEAEVEAANLEVKSMATKVGEEIIKEVKKPKVPEKESRPLTFQERLRGTISLDKIRPNRPAPTTTRRPQDAARPGFSDARPAPLNDGLSDEERLIANAKEKEKSAKGKRSGVKMIGGDLDIEGLGKATTLTHLVRTTLGGDRVFQPAELAARRRKMAGGRKKSKVSTTIEKKASKRFIEMHESISVRDFAEQLSVKSGEIIKKLMGLGVMATINQALDKDTATILAQEYQYEVKDISFNEASVLDEKANVTVDDENKELRPPVVTVMGHVDHGKTSLLDAIRSTNVTDGEAGGITQHIGAYTINLPTGKITFLDTPGHEAFTAMRARGAKVTDFVILVVAADDGVMPQTEESIAHAKAAGVPIIVAVNKCDKPDANPEKVMRQLSERGLLSEEWGGETIFVKVSAKSRDGIPQLLENVLLQAEVLELKANPKKRAVGTVLEAKLDKFRGAVSTLLVQEGTLKVGDSIVVGSIPGRVRAMHDWKGQPIKEAGPSTAVEILGLEGVPEASDSFNVVESDQDAKLVAGHRLDEKRKAEAAQAGKLKLEDMFARMKQGELKELNIILKTDVQGSMEAVRDAVLKLGNAEVKTKIIHAAVGGIRDTDINLASASRAIIIGFNVRPETSAIHLAKDKGVDIKLYKIIYDLVNEVKLAMQGLLTPTIQENYLGRAEVRNSFQVSKVGTVAGCMVVDGQIQRNASIRLLRDSVVIHEGKISSLKRFKDDAKEVKTGFECGIGIEGYQDVKPGDVLEAFIVEHIQRTLD